MTKVLHDSNTVRLAMWLRRVALALVLVTLLGWASLGSASAHADLVRANPAPGSVVASPPAKVELSFTEPVEAPPEAIIVTGPDGRRVEQGEARVAEDDVTTMLVDVAATTEGTYTVEWRAISADTHPVGGTFQFSVGTPSDGALAAGGSTGSTTTPGVPWAAAARWIHLLGAVLALGPLLFRLLAQGRRDPAIEWRLWRLTYLGSLVLIIAAFPLLLAQMIGISGSFRDALSRDLLASVLSSNYGVRWLLRQLLAFILLGIATIALHRTQQGKVRLANSWSIAALAPGAVLLLMTSLNGHPASTDPVWLSVFSDWVHLVATAAWVGGLLVFVFAVAPGLRTRNLSEQLTYLTITVPRFSILALVAVELLVLTGLYATWAHVDSPSALTSSNYGRALLIKLGLIVLTLGFAAINLLVVRPRLAGATRGNPEPTKDAAPLLRTFRRAIAAEAVLGIAILAVVGALTALPPARSQGASVPVVATPEKPALRLMQNAGPTLVTLDITPADVGSNRLNVTLQDPTGNPVDDATVRVRVHPPAEVGGAPSVTQMAADEEGYRATVTLAPAGRWDLEILVSRPGEPEAVAELDLQVPLPSAASILAAADEAMQQLDSLVEVMELSNGIQTATTVYTYAAPNRMHYAVDTPTGRRETIAIEKQRFDREGDGPWEESNWPGLSGYQWPNYAFSTRATDVTLLGTETLDGVECQVIAFMDEPTGTHYRMWIGQEDHLIRQYIMMATGHYMKSVFSDFNAPVAINAPDGMLCLACAD